MADGRWLVGAVDAIVGAAEIHRARAERVAWSAGHEPWQVGLTLDHLGRRVPVRPLLFPGDFLYAGPPKAVTTDAHAVADRLAMAENVIEVGVGGIDNDGSGRLLGKEGHLPS